MRLLDIFLNSFFICRVDIHSFSCAMYFFFLKVSPFSCSRASCDMKCVLHPLSFLCIGSCIWRFDLTRFLFVPHKGTLETGLQTSGRLAWIARISFCHAGGR